MNPIDTYRLHKAGHQFPEPERRPFDKLNVVGMVYFVRAGDDGPIKIGFTAEPIEKRLRALQTGSPEQLHLVGQFRGSRYAERDLHLIFAWARIRGEWFKPSPDLLSLIERRSE